MKTLDIFNTARTVIRETVNPQEVDQQYRYWRKRILYSAFIGYAVYYFCRVNISMALPHMQSDLGYDKFQLGLIVSVLQITYGVGKFLNGIIADRSNPRYVMAIGLFLSGLANLIFGLSSMLWVLVLVWGLNGWFQSMGFPPGARLLSHWYTPKEYGRIWGIFGCSHQVGAAIIFAAGGYLVLMGWQYAFIVPSLFAFITAVFLFNRLGDIPENMGLPPVEEYKGEKLKSLAPARVKSPKFFNEALFKNVLSNKYVWLTAFGNMFLYIVRYGLVTWTPLFISANKGVNITKAGWVLAAFELVGIAGMLLAGYVSDKTFKARRGPTMAIYMFLLAFCIVLFWIAPYGNTILIILILALSGFLVYGPLMLVSVAAATYAGKKSAASASGFTGFWGYVGATISGVGVGGVAEYYGWKGAFMLILFSAFLSAVFFALTWKATPYVEENKV
ncbi:MFS transporter [Adhaeribacter aerolatus]|uniref:MFS transporter n=1 Tax=Adhaeribacter aerolatus TaxID=670289 RepID=A0A512B656_9BACT|nr:MFS transporter [Adhaeribacter aerolatus]GEO07458.1 MFS transporter [Adhaeribacter aerolatus]